MSHVCPRFARSIQRDRADQRRKYHRRFRPDYHQGATDHIRGRSGPSRATVGQAGRMDVRAVLADVAGLGPYFAVGVGPVDPGPDHETGADEAGGGWRPMAELLADRQPLRARIAQVRRWTATSGGRLDHVPGAGRVDVSAPYAAVVVHGVLPRLTATRCTGGRSTGTGRWRSSPARIRPATAVPTPPPAPRRWPSYWWTISCRRWSRRCGRRCRRPSGCSGGVWRRRWPVGSGCWRSARPDRSPGARRRWPDGCWRPVRWPVRANRGRPTDRIGRWSPGRRSCCLYYRVAGRRAVRRTARWTG